MSQRRPLARFARRAVTAAEGALAKRPAGPLPDPDQPLPVTFFLWNVYAMGGTVRTVLRQASALADRGHRVTIVSVVRHHYQREPFFAPDPRVATEVLVDRYRLKRARGPLSSVRRWVDARPAPGSQISLGREQQGSLLTELLVIRRVMGTRGIVMGTRAGLNLAIARFAHPSAVRVAQEHLEFLRYGDPVRRAMRRHFRRLDVVACLTEADARSYRKALRESGPLVAVVPNAIPDAFPGPADLSVHRLIAVGRIEPAKGFDLLVEAFARVAPEHPTWQLRIVGDGRRRGELVEAIRGHGLEDRVELRPGTPEVQAELASGSVYVLSSRFEAFGMVLLEAMATRLAIVSFSCRQGPREFLVPEHNALLAPPKDVLLLAEQLDRAMRDQHLRERLAAQARRDVEAFTVSQVTTRWVEVLEQAAARRHPGAELRDPVAAGRP